MDRRREVAIQKVREALQEVRELAEAAAGLRTEKLQEAVAHLLERQANLDKQWLRALVLDQLGIWVGDDDGNDDENEKRRIVLSVQARRHSGQNFQKYSKESGAHRGDQIPPSFRPMFDLLAGNLQFS